tara:strand:- start:7297 stop:9996 length:2700 start_codon:yes stop_codon:yes gene_type:complete
MGHRSLAGLMIILISFSLVPSLSNQDLISEADNSTLYFSEGISTTTIVDTLDNVGSQSDLALDSQNNVHISYRDSTSGVLKYAFFNGVSWNTTVVDDSSNVGFSTSIVLDSNDHVHICYFDKTNSDLKYAYFDDGNWDISVVSNMSNMGNSISLGISTDDRLHLAFYHHIDYSLPNIKYAVYDSELWNISGIASGTTSGQTISLVVDSSDNVHVTFTGSALSYGFFNGTEWKFSSAAPRGYLNSIAVADDDRVYISHSSGSSWHGHSVDVAMFDGHNWTTLPAPPYNDGQSKPSAISTDSNGNVHIAYFTGCGDYYPYGCDVRYAAYNGTDWQSYELETRVRGNGQSSPSDLAMVIDSDDYVHLSYKNMINEELMYANTIVDFDMDNVRDKIDDCLGILGTSQHDRAGCPDTDGDGYSDPSDSWGESDGGDAFVNDSTQWSDLDGDGYGDNPDGLNADMFPDNPNWWLDLDRDGIEDSLDDDIDGDGISNQFDAWPQDFTRGLDTDGDGLADFVQGKISGELIDFEDGNYGAVNMHCSDDLAGFCMPDYPPWEITNNSITGSYSLEQQTWASDTGHFSISFSSDTDDIVTLQLYISAFLIEQQCIPISMDGVFVDYGCESEGFGYYENITINVSEGDHVLRVYGTVLGEGNRVDNIQLPDYVIFSNEDEDDDNDGWSDYLESSFKETSPCYGDPLDPNITPRTSMDQHLEQEGDRVSNWMGTDIEGFCEVYYDGDGDGIVDYYWESTGFVSVDRCPEEYGYDKGEWVVNETTGISEFNMDNWGCPLESEQEVESSSEGGSSLTYGIGIGLIIAIFVAIFFVRKSGGSVLDESVENAGDLQEESQITGPAHDDAIFSDTPPAEAVGMLNDDGFYWIEWPIASGKWYYRPPNETIWKLFES